MKNETKSERKGETMTIREKIHSLKNELQESSSEQYKVEIRRQIARLEYYCENGHWPR